MKEHFGIVREPEAGVRQTRRPTSTSTPAPAARAAPASSVRRKRRPILREALAPFEDIGVFGAIGDEQPRDRRHRQHVVQQRRPAGHRHRPGSDRVQQRTPGTRTSTPTNASSRTTCKQSAMAIASAVYHLAMRDEMLPRFPAGEMPPLPAGRGGGRGGDSEPKIVSFRSSTLNDNVQVQVPHRPESAWLFDSGHRERRSTNETTSMTAGLVRLHYWHTACETGDMDLLTRPASLPSDACSRPPRSRPWRC